jgi:lipid-binding SYLF domain-containing protein
MFRCLTRDVRRARLARNLDASTEVTMRAEILNYSRSRGVFAGVALEGTSLRSDDDATRRGVWPKANRTHEHRRQRSVATPQLVRHFVDVLQNGAPHNESKRATR